MKKRQGGKMKRVVFGVLVSATLISFMVGCGAPTASPEATQPEVEQPTVAEEQAPEEPVTIRVLTSPDEGENVAIFTSRFEQETGIEVEVDFVGWSEIHDKTVTTLATGGGGYDVVHIGSANAYEIMSMGTFEPINDLIPEEERDEWLESVLDLYTVEGDLLAMPWYSGGAHMAYNSAVLDAAGVDAADIETWDDFLSACAAIAESDASEFCFIPSAKYPGNWIFNWGTMMASLGGEMFDEEANPIFQEGDAALEAFEIIKTGVEEGYFDEGGIALDDYETLIAFGAGSSAFLLDSTWSVTQATSNPELSTVTDVTQLMLIPGGNGVRTAGYMYAGGLGLLKSSEHKEEAKQYIAYLTGPEAQKHRAIEGANFPTRVALFADEEIAEAWIGYEVLAEQLQHGKFPPQYTWWEQLRQSAATAVQDVMADRKSPEEAVAWLVEETDRVKSQ
jgi:multiple sugar transport system substrate-binding protein